jgi:hypothetical protein
MYAAVTRDEGNAADDVLMVDQGTTPFALDISPSLLYIPLPTIPEKDTGHVHCKQFKERA